MNKDTKKKLRRDKIRRRIRSDIRGTSERPRLCVKKSNKHINAQLIDDTIGSTLLSVSSSGKAIQEELQDNSRIGKASVVGETLAKAAQDKGINQVVFDRSGYKYHGAVKALAEAAREGGLDF